MVFNKQPKDRINNNSFTTEETPVPSRNTTLNPIKILKKLN